MTTTPSSTTYSPGDLVKVRIRFTAGASTKTRPAVILSDTAYHASRRDALVMPVSTKRADMYHGDHDLADWKSAGLPAPSKAKCTLDTIDRATIKGTYGKLSDADFAHVKANLRSVLGL